MLIGALTGSITQTPQGTSYLVAGSNITIVSGTNGQITISSTATGGSGSSPSSISIVDGAQITTQTAYVSVGAISLDATGSYPGKNFSLAIILQTTSASRIGYARLFNTTDSLSIVELDNSLSVRTVPTKLTSSLLGIPAGEKIYELQIKIDSSTSDAVICKSAALVLS
jgi:hypothetical protein